MWRLAFIAALGLVLVAALPVPLMAQETTAAEAAPSPAGIVTISAEEWAALTAEVEKLRREIDALKSAEVPVDEMEPETGPPSAPAAEAMVIGGASAAGVPQTLLPDISVIGNVVGLASSDRTRGGRNEVLLRELEIGLQGYLYPSIRADAFIALERDHDYTAELEEGYISFLQLNAIPTLRNLPDGLALRLGRKLVDFGRVNPIHPHHWDFVNAPVVIQNLLGDHFTGDGAQLDYLLPTRTFANLQLGLWRAPGHHDHDHDDDHDHDADHNHNHHGELGTGFEERFRTARLWLSRPMGADAELEFGASAAWGRAEAVHYEHHDHEHEVEAARYRIADAEDDHSPARDRIRLHGVDLTYRRWPGGFRRLTLRGEGIWHRRANAEGDTRFGHYLFTNYRWDQYWDAGLLLSASQRPWPGEGRDSALSAILTNRLTETTALRLQLDRVNRHDLGRATELWLQVLWGIGPHSHPLE